MKKYQTGFKLKVVTSFLAGDGGAKLLARQWSVPEEKIRTWVSHYRLHGIDGLRPSAARTVRSSNCRYCPIRIANSSPAARSRRSMTSAIPTKSWSGDAISIKAACRLCRLLRIRKKSVPR